MADPGGFVGRWARLKTETRERVRRGPEVSEVPPASDNLPAVRSDDAARAPEEGRTDAELLAEHKLPDIESLTEESDFTEFMKEGVPERLRNLALRKLWRSNPVFANLDGLNEYDEDYSQVVEIVGGIANYMPGRGYADEDDAPADEVAETGEATARAGDAETGDEGVDRPSPEAESVATETVATETVEDKRDIAPVDDAAIGTVGRKSDA